MRTRLLPILTATSAALLAGCGGASRQSTEQADVSQILSVLQSARTALLNDRPREVCGLLTAHGRSRLLGFQVDFAKEGTRVPSKDPGLPRTCEAVIERERQLRSADGGGAWLADLRRVRFSVVSIDGPTAQAQLKVAKPYGPVIDLSLRKTPAGWRIDDSAHGIPIGY